MKTISIKYSEMIYSPYSGLPVEDEDGCNKNDDTLILVCYGDAGTEPHYIAERIRNVVNEDDDIKKVIRSLDIPDAIALEVDTDWNGVNYYIFAPSSS